MTDEPKTNAKAKEFDANAAPEALYEHLQFFRTEAKDYYDRIERIINNEMSMNRGQLILKVEKLRTDAGDEVIGISRLVMHRSLPKLESIAVKAEVGNRFVIVAPEAPQDKAAWMRSVGAEYLPAVIHPHDDNKVVSEVEKV